MYFLFYTLLPVCLIGFLGYLGDEIPRVHRGGGWAIATVMARGLAGMIASIVVVLGIIVIFMVLTTIGILAAFAVIWFLRWLYVADPIWFGILMAIIVVGIFYIHDNSRKKFAERERNEQRG
jgi:hypothetical protein